MLGDVIRLEPGDQVIADGQLVAARALSLDESMLTGESEAVNRAVGEKILSGVFCTAGSADYVVEAIGADSYAERLAAEARSTSAPLSPLQLDVNRILRITVMVMVPLAVLLVTSLALRDTSIREAGRTAVAGLLPLRARGARAADQPHVRRRGRAPRAPGDACAAHQRHREPRKRRRRLSRQDRHLDR